MSVPHNQPQPGVSRDTRVHHKWLVSILILYLARMRGERGAYIFSEYCKVSAHVTAQAPPCTLSHLILRTGEEGGSSTPSGSSRASHGRAGS